MRRRLYFLFPDVGHAQEAVNELREAHVSDTDMHVLAQRVEDEQVLLSRGVPMATPEQRRDRLHQLEHRLWGYNMTLFFVAAGGAVFSAVMGWGVVAVILALIAIADFVTGAIWANVPDTSLAEFTDALSHGDLLLMVDMERQSLCRVESLVTRRHPEAVLGGSTFLPP